MSYFPRVIPNLWADGTIDTSSGITGATFILQPIGENTVVGNFTGNTGLPSTHRISTSTILGRGSGNIQNISLTNGLTLMGNLGPTMSLTNTGVISAQYGGTGSSGTYNVPQIDIDNQGRITSASNIPITYVHSATGGTGINISNNNGNITISTIENSHTQNYVVYAQTPAYGGGLIPELEVFLPYTQYKTYGGYQIDLTVMGHSNIENASIVATGNIAFNVAGIGATATVLGSSKQSLGNNISGSPNIRIPSSSNYNTDYNFTTDSISIRVQGISANIVNWTVFYTIYNIGA